MKPYIPRGIDPYTLDDPYPDDVPRRPSRFGIIAAWVFAGVVLVGTAIFLAVP